MPAIVEGWIDKVLAPPWAFRFKQLVGNYGYPIGNLRDKKAIIFCTYGSPRLAITTFFLNLPIRRLKRGVFHMCGIYNICLLYTSPSPRDVSRSRMPSSA